ncbi:4-hydroxy-3-methylbut-2-enyl diphosphate reductase [Streptomyces sp. NPDC001401]|uniref:4-hydroxy-3-methylbut-2-enyl diphosphate reductase n=1 Tax=Streptomyces sp. NPDC001401 TaxID=3364570 RepID=UPI00367877AE
MNRSIRSEVLHSATLRLPPRTLLAATSWLHPDRGPVSCPAGPLIAARARHAGFATATGTLSAPTSTEEPAAAAATLFTISYEQPDGGYAGLALAASGDDTAAMSYARQEIAAWRSALRTRRVLYVADTSVSDPTEVMEPALPQQSRHRSRDAWQVCGCRTGTTCAAADNAARTLRLFLARGDEVVMVGQPAFDIGAQPGTPLHQGRTRITTTQHAETVTVTDPNRLAFVVSPGTAVSDAAGIIKVLRRRFPRLRGQHPCEWCYTADDLRVAVASVLAQTDVLLITGTGPSPAARTAVSEAARADVRIRDVTSLERLRPQDLDAATIAVVDAAADGHVGRAVSQALAGLGPAGHILRCVQSRPVAGAVSSDARLRPWAWPSAPF